jgi:hypothetical protein
MRSGRMFKQHSRKRAVFRFSLAIGAFVLLLVGVSFFQTPADATTDHSTKIAGGPDWKSLSRTDKKDYMRDTVMPRMEELFGKFDVNKYGHVKCTLCHGNGARTGTYKMPDAKIPKIPKDAAGLAKLDKKMPAMMKFMRETISPEMARLIGAKKYDCEGCHKTK